MPPEFIPSKKVIITGSLLAIFIGWLFWVPTTDTFKLKNLKLGKKLQTFAQNEQADIDSDKDGLKDWEEALWHSDINNPDTDQDGTPDGEEVLANRSPTTPGPDDLLSDLAALQKSIAASTTVNLTQSVSQSLLAKFISAKSSGASTKDLSQKLLSETTLPAYQDEVTLENISLSDDNSTAAIKTYFNAVGAIAGREFKKLNGVFTVLLAIQENPDYSQLEKLSADAYAYGAIAADVRALKAPNSLSLIHLDIINTALNAQKAVLEIQKMGSDTLLAARGWNEFLKADERLTAIIKKVNAVLVRKNIAFKPSDPGYIFKSYNK